jgi:hypothetical protein
MILYILSDYFSRYIIAYGPGKIPIFPKLTTPKMFLYLRMLAKDHTCTDTPHYSHNLGYAVSRWERQEYVNMIQGYFHRIYLKPMINGNFFKYNSYSLLDVSSQYPLPILWRPYQVIFRVIYSMWRSFNCHVLCIAQLTLPLAGKLFIPVHRTGYSSFKIS